VVGALAVAAALSQELSQLPFVAGWNVHQSRNGWRIF